MLTGFDCLTGVVKSNPWNDSVGTKSSCVGLTVGLGSSLCLGVGRVLLALGMLALPELTFCLAGKDLKLGFDSFLGDTLWLGFLCPFLPLPASLLGLFPRILFSLLIIPLSSFISWIAASISEVFSIMLSSFISLITASISTGSKDSDSALLSFAIFKRLFKALDSSLIFLSLTAETLCEVLPDFCPFLRIPSLLLPVTLTEGFLLGFLVV